MRPFKRLSTTRANTPSSTRSSRPSGGYALTRCARSPFPLLTHLRVTVIASLVWGSGGGHIAFTPTRVARIFEKSTSGLAGEEVGDKEGQGVRSRDGRYLLNSRRMANGWLAHLTRPNCSRFTFRPSPHRDASGRYRPTAATVPRGASMERNWAWLLYDDT